MWTVGSVFKRMDTFSRDSVILKEWCVYISTLETENIASLCIRKKDKQYSINILIGIGKNLSNYNINQQVIGICFVGRDATKDLKCFVKL